MKVRVLVAAGAGVLSATLIPFSVGRAATAPPITFAHEVTVDPNRMNGEPDVAIADNGREMYTSGPWGFTTTVSMAWKSEDAGVQWDLLHGSCPANPLRPFCSRGGGDSEVELGTPQGTGNSEQTAYFGDLNGLDTISCAYSTNGGDTFTVTGNPGLTGQVCNVAAPTAPGSDRQWIAVWPAADNGGSADKLFMVYDTGDTPPSGDDALMSLDGGHSWQLACQSVSTSGTTSCVGGSNAFGSRPGPLLINPTAINTVTTANGSSWPTLYQFMATNSTGPEVNISCDGGQTWSHELITPTIAGGGLTITNDFIVGAIDTAGGLYAAWTRQSSNGTGPWQVFYSRSTDSAGTTGIGNCSIPVQGAAWSPELPVTGPGSNAPSVNYGVMPAIAAGDPGRVDVAYYGDSTDSNVHPDTDNSAVWSLHMSQTLNGNTTTPTFSDVTATEQPMHHHSICFLGLSCMEPLSNPAGDRNLADFFEVRPDPSGRAVIMFVDDNNTQPGPPAPAGQTGAGVISSVQQATGPSLYAANPGLGRTGFVPGLTSGLSQSLDLRNEVTDPPNDALLPGHQPAPGANVPAADLTDLKVTPNGPNLVFKFTVQNMGAGPSSAVVNNAATAAAAEVHTGAIWLATWHFNNDFWFTSATTPAAGNALTCLAGRPLDAFSSSAPKTLQYEQDPQNNLNHVVAGCSVTGNTIEIDVPLSDIGNPASTDVLYGLSGFTADTSDAVATAGITGGTAPEAAQGNAGFLDAIDQTAPIDVPLGTAPTSTPEFPALPLVVGLGALATGGVALRRRRRATVD